MLMLMQTFLPMQLTAIPSQVWELVLMSCFVERALPIKSFIEWLNKTVIFTAIREQKAVFDLDPDAITWF